MTRWTLAQTSIAVLEAIHRRAVQGQYVTPEDIPTLVEETWLSTPRTRPEQEKAYHQAAVHQLQRYLEQYGKCLPMTVNAETYFSTAHDRQVLLGKIDLIRRVEEQGMEIVDFKTSASDPRELGQTELQLSIYAVLGVESQIEQPVVRISAHFLGDVQVKSWPWDAEWKCAFQRNCRKTRNSITTVEKVISEGGNIPA